MAAHQRKNWAIVCGKVRDAPACLRKLQTLAAWRAEGLIDGVVFSTWTDELNSFPEVLAALKAQDAVVVEVAEPRLRLPGHVLHQMVSIYYALQAVPNDAHVLRLRPDLIALSPEMADFLAKEPSLALHALDGWPAIFSEQVVVLEGLALAPLYLNDMTFYGRKADIAAICNMDLRKEVLFSAMAPEQFFFTNPFTDRLKVLQAYYGVACAFRFQNAAWARRYVELHLGSDFFCRVLLTYLLCLRKYFRIGFDTVAPPPARVLRQLQPTAILTGDAPLQGVEFRDNLHQPILKSPVLVNGLLDRLFAADALTEKLEAMQAQMSLWSVQSGWTANPLTPSAEVRRFAEEVGRPLGTASPRLDNRQDPEGHAFRMPFAGDRWQVLSGSDEVRSLTEENNTLRRTVDALQNRLTTIASRSSD